MNKTYTTSAIILNRKDRGEADRIFSLYTKDHGKIEAVATSARKSTSKMAKFLESLMEIELLLAKGKNYDKIAEVKLIDNFTELKQNSRLWALGCYCIEVVDKLTKVEVPQEDVFDLLKSILNLLKSGNSSLIQFYVLKLLSKLGYSPRLDGCAVCEKRFEIIRAEQEHLVFSSEKGGVVCDKCLASKKGVGSIALASLRSVRDYGANGVRISFSTVDFLRRGAVEELTFLQNIDINQWESREINRAISLLLNFHLDCGLNSARLISNQQQVNGN
ncbi:MAG: DNA repair protein RecO [bacterium]